MNCSSTKYLKCYPLRVPETGNSEDLEHTLSVHLLKFIFHLQVIIIQFVFNHFFNTFLQLVYMLEFGSGYPEASESRGPMVLRGAKCCNPVSGPSFFH
jgi:hypothetical protein